MKRILLFLLSIFFFNSAIHSMHIDSMPSNLKSKAALQAGAFPKDLPLIVTPAKNDSLPFAIIISGAGGWTSWDQSVATSLAQKGIASVGLDAQKYFWNKKTPEETTLAVSKIIQHYSALWKKQKFMLIGYSFGADVIPFIANRLPSDLKTKIELITLLSPDKKADFEIHLSDMLNFGNSNDRYDVVKELNTLSKNKIICLFGEGEDLNTRSGFEKTTAKIHVLHGDHHFSNNFTGITDLIMTYTNHN